MDILFHVTTPDSAHILALLARAATRTGAGFGCFFTHAGVACLNDADVRDALQTSRRSVVCEDSWHRYAAGLPCPVEKGSQTTNSALMGEARRVVSL